MAKMNYSKLIKEKYPNAQKSNSEKNEIIFVLPIEVK